MAASLLALPATPAAYASPMHEDCLPHQPSSSSSSTASAVNAPTVKRRRVLDACPPTPLCSATTTTTTPTSTLLPLLAHVSGVMSVAHPATPQTQLLVPSQSSHRLHTAGHMSALLARQSQRMPALAFLSIQRGNAERFRKDAVEWLINVNAQYKYFRYHTETLFLAVNFMDRFLSKERLDRSARYYLLAMVSLAAACKITEEFNDPLMEDMLMHLQPWQFTSKQIRQFERRLLLALNYELTAVTPVDILYGFLNTTTMKSLLPLVTSSSVHLPPLLRRHSLPNLSRSASQGLNPLCTCSTCSAASLASSKHNEHWSHCCGQAPTIVMPIIRIAENYLIRCLPHYEFTAYQPSVLAMAALNVALECITASISLQAQQQQQQPQPQQHLHLYQQHQQLQAQQQQQQQQQQQLAQLRSSRQILATAEAILLSSSSVLVPVSASASSSLSPQETSLLKQAVAGHNLQLPSPLPSPTYTAFPGLPTLATSLAASEAAAAAAAAARNCQPAVGVPVAVSSTSTSTPLPQPSRLQYPQSLALGFAPSALVVPLESRQLTSCMSRFLQLLTTEQALMILRQSQSQVQ